MDITDSPRELDMTMSLSQHYKRVGPSLMPISEEEDKRERAGTNRLLAATVIAVGKMLKNVWATCFGISTLTLRFCL